MMNEDLVNDVKRKVLNGIEEARKALLNDPAVDYDSLSATLLTDLDEYFTMSITMPDIYGKLEVPKNVRKKKAARDRICEIHYAITCNVPSPAVLELIRSSAPPEIVFNEDHIRVQQALGDREIDDADFKGAVFAVRRFLDTIDVLKKDVDEIVAEAKAGLQQQIAALFVEHRAQMAAHRPLAK